MSDALLCFSLDFSPFGRRPKVSASDLKVGEIKLMGCKKVRVCHVTHPLLLLLPLLLLVLHPDASIYECLDPRCHLIGAAVERVVTALPGEDTTLQVGHHSYMAAISAGDTGDVVCRTVGVGRIAGIVVLGHDVVAALLVGEGKLTLTVSYPDTVLGTAERTEEYAVVLGYMYTHKVRLKLV